MSTGYGWEYLRQVCVTLLGAWHVPERLSGCLVYMRRYNKCLLLPFLPSSRNVKLIREANRREAMHTPAGWMTSETGLLHVKQCLVRAEHRLQAISCPHGMNFTACSLLHNWHWRTPWCLQHQQQHQRLVYSILSALLTACQRTVHAYHVIVRPLSTVGYTSVASVIHCRQWSNYYNSWPFARGQCNAIARM